MTAGRLHRINGSSSGIADAARCPGCSHPARIHNVAGCVHGQCECAVTRVELGLAGPKLEVPDAPVAPPAEPAPPMPAALRAPAVAPTEPAPVRAEAAGPAGDLVVEQVAPAASAPVTTGRFVRWEPVPATVQVTPSAVDFEPLLAAALYVSARWYCPRCHHWPLNPGPCPGCRQTLQAVYHVTIPREIS